MILAYRSFFTPLILYQYFYTITVWLFFSVNSYFLILNYVFYILYNSAKTSYSLSIFLTILDIYFVANISFILSITFSFLS